MVPLVIFLGGCGGERSATPPAAQPAVELVGGSSSSVPVRGIASISGGTANLSECGAPSGAVTAVSDPNGELAKAFAALAAKPGEGLYVELDGAPSADGRTLVLSALRRARALPGVRPCEAPVFEGEFVANGNEPFWAIEVREKGIVYRDPAIPKGRTYPYAFTRTETGSVLYATKIATPAVSTLEIALEPARCIDSMSGELRSLKAHVTLDGRRLEGCAALGVPHGEFGNAPLDELDRFTGTHPHTVRLWKDSLIEKRLEALLGAALPAFLEDMKASGPLMKDDGVYYVAGSKPRQGGLDGAFFVADPASDTISVILFTHGARRDFKEGGREIALPAEVVTTIGQMEQR